MVDLIKLFFFENTKKENYFVDIVGFLESIFMFDDTFYFEVVSSDQLPRNTYARYLPLDNKMEILESVYNEALNGDGRARFTIAHEIGHYFLHKDTSSFSRRLSKKDIKAYEDPEWQANTFASFFLISQNAISNLKSPEAIAENCGTSYSAAEIAIRKAKKGKS